MCILFNISKKETHHPFGAVSFYLMELTSLNLGKNKESDG